MYTHSPVLEIKFWQYRKYLTADDPSGPPSFIEPSSILSQACRLTAWVPNTRNTGAGDVDGADDEDDDDDDQDEEDVPLQSEGHREELAQIDDDKKVWITVGLTKVIVMPILSPRTS